MALRAAAVEVAQEETVQEAVQEEMALAGVACARGLLSA